jgi:hypothetical protein
MVFSFFWVFCTSLPNQVKHTWLKSQLQICKYEWARIIFVDMGLDSKLQHYGLCKISPQKKKKKNTSHLDRGGHIEGDVMQNHEQKKKWKKVKIQYFMGKPNYLSYHLALQPLGNFSHMAACRNSTKNTRKMSLIPVFNKNSPRAYTESELDVLGVHGKLVKYVVHSSKGRNWKKIKIFSQAAQTAND